MTASRLLRATLAVCAAALLLPSMAAAADGPAIPLPARNAKDLELLGQGVVGKAGGTVDADAKRTAKHVVEKLKPFFERQGWITD